MSVGSQATRLLTGAHALDDTHTHVQVAPIYRRTQLLEHGPRCRTRCALCVLLIVDRQSSHDPWRSILPKMLRTRPQLLQ